MTTRNPKTPLEFFARFALAVAMLFMWQVLEACAEGGGVGLIDEILDSGLAPVDTGPVEPEPKCGDGIINGTNETCDGDDLGGATCESLGEGAGELGCYTASCTYDVTMCNEEPEVAGSGGYGEGGSNGGGTAGI